MHQHATVVFVVPVIFALSIYSNLARILKIIELASLAVLTPFLVSKVCKQKSGNSTFEQRLDFSRCLACGVGLDTLFHYGRRELGKKIFNVRIVLSSRNLVALTLFRYVLILVGILMRSFRILCRRLKISSTENATIIMVISKKRIYKIHIVKH